MRLTIIASHRRNGHRTSHHTSLYLSHRAEKPSCNRTIIIKMRMIDMSKITTKMRKSVFKNKSRQLVTTRRQSIQQTTFRRARIRRHTLLQIMTMCNSNISNKCSLMFSTEMSVRVITRDRRQLKTNMLERQAVDFRLWLAMIWDTLKVVKTVLHPMRS